jgi:hypothetical protein
LQTTDEDISTLPKMRKYLGERFKCPVIELDALWDFKTFFARQAAKMSGHSFPYSFRFERDAHQAVKTTYQTSEDCTGRWYDMEPLESVPEVFSWEIPFMKLRRYSDLAEYHESGNDEVDAILQLKLVNELDANTVSLPNGDSARSLPEDSVTWWREHIATLKDEAWVTVIIQSLRSGQSGRGAGSGTENGLRSDPKGSRVNNPLSNRLSGSMV